MDSGQSEVHALVLSGCGCSSTDSYAVGAMKALMETGCSHLGGKPLDPAIYSGSAFGAFNAAVMASNIAGDAVSTLRYLERAWLEDISSTRISCGNGVYRLRGNPLAYFNPRCYNPNPVKPFIETFTDFVFLSSDLLARFWTFLGPHSQGSLWQRLQEIPSAFPFFDMEPFKKQLRKHVNLESLRRSDKELIVTATDWIKGVARAFTKPEMTDQQGHAILQASAAYFLMFPFVAIDGRPYGGGPSTMATPIKPVIEIYSAPQRTLVAHVIFINPPMEEVPILKMNSFLYGMGRYFTLNQANNTNAVVEYSPEVTRRESPDWKSVIIHCYRPSKAIVNWFEWASFDRKLTEGFIAQGYDDARRHDCKAAGCTLK